MKSNAAWLAIALATAAPALAFAFGSIGCADLPEHDRAVGALEGMTGACDMSVEQARRILARDAGQSAGAEQGALPPYAAPQPRHRKHRRQRDRS